MSDKVGMMFSEVMSGGFALNQTEPEAGADAGKGQPLTMHGTITIEDLDTFIADPKHLGRLDVRMDWEPFGSDVPALNGIFNLFSPTSDPTLKLMVYEWGTVHDHKNYYFAGQKDVKVHPLFDLWKDATTLYTKLYEGTDKTGKVVGAGILELTPAELFKMTGTFTALNAASVPESLRATTAFGRFFLGEMWDTYVKKVGARV
jgi:choline dehydrogenase-like flavoprotein